MKMGPVSKLWKAKWPGNEESSIYTQEAYNCHSFASSFLGLASNVYTVNS